MVHANDAGEDLVFESFLLFLNERDDFSFLNPMVTTSWLQLTVSLFASPTHVLFFSQSEEMGGKGTSFSSQTGGKQGKMLV